MGVVHQVFIFNAPSAMAKLLSIVTSVMNERMKAKLQVFPAVEAQTALSTRIDAKAIYSWFTQMSSNKIEDLALAGGAEEFQVEWMKKGEVVKCKVSTAKGISFRY